MKRYPKLFLTVFVFVVSALSTATRAADDAGFAGQFHADDHTFFVIEDPLLHLKALLTSETLRHACARGSLGEMMHDRAGQLIDPVTGWDWIKTNQRWIPRQIAVGISDAGMEDLDHLTRLIAIAELLEGGMSAKADGVAAAKAELASLRKSALAELKQIRMPRMRIYVRFRQAEDAAALLEMVKLQIQDIDPKDLPAGVKIDRTERSVTAKFTLKDFFTTDEAISAALDSLGLVDADDEAGEKELIAAVRRLEAEATLELAGTGLLLTLGPVSAGGQTGLPARVANLPAAVGKADVATLAWSRWDARKMKEILAGWTKLHERWAKSASYAAASRLPDHAAGNLTVDNLQDVAVTMASVSNAGALRLWADPGDSAIRLATLDEGTAPAADLSKHAVSRFVPADAEAFQIDTTTSLGDKVSDWLMQVESRMAMQSLRGEMKGGNPAAGVMESGYYTHFAKFRELVHQVGRDRFEPGFATVLTTQGNVARIEATLLLQTEPVRLSGRNLPVPELAIIGVPKATVDEAAIHQYLDELHASFATGIRAAARTPDEAAQPMPVMKTAAGKIDLGLDVPTWGYDAGWMTKLTGEAKLQIAVDGDLRPHFFLLDGCLVYSTSPRLSKAMIAARNDRAKRLSIHFDGEGVLIGSGKMTGETLARLTDHFSAWLKAMRQNGGGEAQEKGSVFLVVEQLSRLIDRLEWKTMQPAGERSTVTRGAIYFATEGK